MTLHFNSQHHKETPYIRVNTSRCKACWNCVNACPQGVLGKVDIPFHHHVRIVQAEKCTGCLLCFDACLHQAILAKEGTHDNISQ